MDKTYNPGLTEKKIYAFWEKLGAFSPESKTGKNQGKFSIIMPPPNANAPLHIGHARFVAIQDTLVRYHRLCQESVLWLPGADHAGIATQVLFEKKLAEEGKTRFDLGRKKFFEEVYLFTQKNKKTMYDQMRSLGASCDWKREKFTLDPQITTVVLETFIKMFKQNLIYRSAKMINWCPRCQTALSDLEVVHEEEKTQLWFIRYLFDHENRFLTVATTRPETLLGDTAVCVNPKDPRYQGLIGKTLVVPLIFRKIPIIADEVVDPAFGTGAVKVTPAHDPVDFILGEKNRLEAINVIGFDNHLTKKAGKYANLTVSEARKKIVEDLEAKGQLEKAEEYSHEVGRCERCHTIIEPQISLQWFVKTKPLAKKAIAAVKTKKTKILPAMFEKTYFQWMENIRDWCISRQLWWGQQIPVYYCGSDLLSPLQKLMNPDLSAVDTIGCGEIIASLDKPIKCPKCGNKNLIQDPDTLDTWFSSGQWPFTALGFPKGKDYQAFYPTSLLETGYDILFFWVARMMMMSLFRTRHVPFKIVYLHGLVRDAFGKKMSKSKGNTLNPLELTSRFGADALRLALIFGSTPGKDISLSEEKIKAMRNFANKIWNASRFVFSFSPKMPKNTPLKKDENPDDLWIKKELQKTIQNTTSQIDNYNLGQAAEILYEFFWHIFCDKYLEMVKPRLYDQNPEVDKTSKLAAVRTLYQVLANSLILLHPFMPFLTEEVWQIGRKISSEFFPDKALILSTWPKR